MSALVPFMDSNRGSRRAFLPSAGGLSSQYGRQDDGLSCPSHASFLISSVGPLLGFSLTSFRSAACCSTCHILGAQGRRATGFAAPCLRTREREERTVVAARMRTRRRSATCCSRKTVKVRFSSGMICTHTDGPVRCQEARK